MNTNAQLEAPQHHSEGISDAGANDEEKNLRTDPAMAYQNYVGLAETGRLEAILDSMTEEYSSELRRLSSSEEFGAFLGAWREIQSEKVEVLSTQIDGDVSVLKVREGNRWLRVQMHYVLDNWLVHQEIYLKPQPC